MKLSIARALTALIVIAGLGGALGQIVGGCAQTPTPVPVHSLGNSGQVSFVCLDPPWFPGQMERPLSDCTSQQFTSTCQYLFENDAGDIDAGSGTLPHLYALVTQTATGEVAVIDTSTSVNSVLDEDPLEPGANFLKVGAAPTGIVSTPGGVATFVGTSGPNGGPGIFALPSSQIRPSSVGGTPDTCVGGVNDAGMEQPIPTYTSWPACSLPVPPGDMIIVNDPADDEGNERESCDSVDDAGLPDYVPVDPAADPISAKEDGTTHHPGRPKLVMTLPKLGGIIVVDAQGLMERPPGSFAPCTIERWLPLQVNLSDIESLTSVPAPLPINACGNAAPDMPPLLLGTACQSDGDCGGIAGSCVSGSCTYTARPGGISFAPDTGQLYIADVGAPLIHVVDLSQVCEPVERPPLIPSSAEVPQRPVVTSRVAVSPQPTPDTKRYLYANDVQKGSAMVFDVSATATTRRPLQRAHPEWNPFADRDRIQFPAPVADIILVQHELPNIDPVSGVAPGGVLCNPDPNAVTCVSIDTNCDIGTSYRTSSDYTLGAGPQKLRGQFGFAVLTNGQVSVIDVADFDAPCRGPATPSILAGCATNGRGTLDTSAEISCNVVASGVGEVRGNLYEGVGTYPGNHVPGIQSSPQLYNNDGSTYNATATVTPPMMVATLPAGYPATVPSACLGQCNALGCGNTCDDLPGCPLELFLGGVQTPVDFEAGQCSTAASFTPGAIGPNNALLMNLEEPRAQVADQNWTVVYEGPVPGFASRSAPLTVAGPCQTNADCPAGVTCDPVMKQCAAELEDPNSLFCAAGVLSENAMTELLQQQQTPPAGLNAADLADYVQITSDLPSAESSYWTEPGTACNGSLPGGKSGNYSTCFDMFGSLDAPDLNPQRDLRIVEAYQDRVEVTVRHPELGVTYADILCCFPTKLSFSVRVGSQWIVTGDQTGFIHHVVADATTGACRNACDPVLSRRNGRLIESPRTVPYIPDRAPGAFDPSPSFLNPMFRFGIIAGEKTCHSNAECDTGNVCSAQGTPLIGLNLCPAGQTCSCTTKIATLGKPCTTDAQCGAGGACPTCTGSSCPPRTCVALPELVSARGDTFRFATSGSFQPLTVALSTATTLIAPQAVTYLAPTFELAVTDGSNNGVIFVSLQTPGVSRSFF